MLQQEMFRTLNNALSPLGVRLTDAGNGQWSISDGHSLMRFQDGVVSSLRFPDTCPDAELCFSAQPDAEMFFSAHPEPYI